MPDADHLAHRRSVWTALFVTLLWSSSWLLIRQGLDDEQLAPLTFAGLRYSLAAIVLVGVALGRRTSRREIVRLDRSAMGWLALLGVVFVAVTQGAQFVAIDNQPAATTSLMLSPTPLLVAACSARLLGERPDRRQFVGAALVAIGAVCYFVGDLGATVIGMVASTVGLAANVTGSLLGRRVNREARTSPLTITAISMSIGAALLLSIGVAVEGRPQLSWTAALIIGWLAVVNTAVAFTLWNRSLQHLAAVESSAINNTMLIQIAILAWVFLDEAPGAMGVTGILIVSLGAFLAQARSR